MARPTAKDPVGVGSVSSLRRSSQSDPSSAPTTTTPDTASIAKLLNIFRERKVLCTIESMRLLVKGGWPARPDSHAWSRQVGQILTGSRRRVLPKLQDLSDRFPLRPHGE